MNTTSTKHSMKEMIDLVFKAIALAMGVAGATLGILGNVPAETIVILLGIGLFCLSITQLEKE
jgi:hypothetical protein